MCTWIDLLLSHLYNDYWIKWIILNPYCESGGLNNVTQTSISRIIMHAANCNIHRYSFSPNEFINVYSGRMRDNNNNKSTHTHTNRAYLHIKIRCCVPYFLFVYAYAHTSRHNGSNNTWRALNAFVFHTSCMDFRRFLCVQSRAARTISTSYLCWFVCVCVCLCVMRNCLFRAPFLRAIPRAIHIGNDVMHSSERSTCEFEQWIIYNYLCVFHASCLWVKNTNTENARPL